MNKRNPLYTKAPTPLPPDLMARCAKPYSPSVNGVGKSVLADPRVKMVNEILENTSILVSAQIIERGLIGRTISVTTTPVQIIDGRFQRAYRILNPTTSASGALTLGGTSLASVQRAGGSSGNTQSTSLGVANYREMTLFLDISAAGGGVVTIDVQSQDPVSLNWATTQSAIFGGQSAVGTYYADIGSLGVDNAFAVAFSVSAAGTSTFSVGHILKDGLPGTASGAEKTIFLGGPDVTTTTGFPLLEGNQETVWARPNTTLYAISRVATGTDLSVFELQ